MREGRPATGQTIIFVGSVEAPRAPMEGAFPRIIGESHLGLRVTNLERSLRFYVDVLGFTPHRVVPTQAILTCGRWVMALYPTINRTDGTPPKHPYEIDRAGLHHLAFGLGSAAEVDAAAEWLDRNDVPHKRPSDGATEGSRFVTFYDPDGIPLEYYFYDAAYADIYGLQDVLEPPIAEMRSM
ncbi:MAG TPA: VOC family protein [Chloroflexota bacterium]|nr:VOC family protein [Chloroflexota bacterium]